MQVNIGGEPERDDYGLPPVDIEIPDDARELDRDVLAYHRELRAGHRRRLTRRLRAALTRDGMALPLLASCLAFILLAGSTLTLFSAGRVLRGPARPTASASPPAAGTTQISALLPDTTAQVDGKPVQLRTLVPLVLALVPSGCRCAAALRRLSDQAAAAGIQIYLVGPDRWMPEVKALAAQNTKDSAHVVDDAKDMLGSAYRRAGLTAVLVYADSSIAGVVRHVGPGVQLASSLKALPHDVPQGLGSAQPAG
jgi:hypothetical protein